MGTASAGNIFMIRSAPEPVLSLINEPNVSTVHLQGAFAFKRSPAGRMLKNGSEEFNTLKLT